MRRTAAWRYVLVGLLAYLAFLVVQFPAERAYAYWKNGPGAAQSIALSGLSGSVWAGRAELVLIDGQRLEAVHWRLKPWTALTGRLALAWEARLKDGFARGVAAADPGGEIELNPLEARLPLAQVTLESLAALRPVGTVNLKLHDVVWDGQTLRSATGRVVWGGAGISLLQPLLFGDLALNLETSADGVRGVFTDGGGPLQMDGLLTITPDGGYQFNASLAARPESPPALANALRSLGRPGPDGKVRVSYAGRLASLGLGPARR